MSAFRRLCSLLLTTVVFLIATNSTLAVDSVRSNQPAPALDLQQILRAPNGSRATWDALRGKVVVLEFWATWCPTCVKSIPHFNALVDELKDKPVQFISITDEDPATVRSFLA